MACSTVGSFTVTYGGVNNKAGYDVKECGPVQIDG